MTPGGAGGDAASVALAEKIRGQLTRILSSRAFQSSERLSQFLRVIVEHTMAGETAVTEYGIGFDVFHRDEHFDPRTDPIVRVHARRLRARLKQYYETDGAGDEIEIALPVRTYIPQIRWRAPHLETKESTIAVMPLASLSAEREDEYFATGLTQELIYALTRLPKLRVLALDNGAAGIDAVMVLQGTVRRFDGHARICVQLLSAGAVLWSEMYERAVTGILALQQNLAQEISAALARHLSGGVTAASSHQA